MKLSVNYFLPIIFLLLASFTSRLNAQSWTNTNSTEGYFVENNGEYSEINKSDVLYSARINNYHIYFTNKGVLYEARDFGTHQEYKSRAKQRRKGVDAPKYDSDFFAMEFTNINTQVKITPSGLLSHYHSFIDPKDHSKSRRTSCYNQITYENVWNNIDVEFLLPAEGGLKYNIIVHPGGNVDDISFNYPFADHIELLESGNLAVSSAFGIISDKAPISYLAGNKLEVESSFDLIGNQLKFEVGNYDPIQTLVIDPWLTVPAATAMGADPYDVDYDDFGNVYIDKHDEIEKYDVSGTLLWSFSVSRNMYGDITVKRSTGEAFISDGMLMGASNAIVKLDAAGTLINTFNMISPGGPNISEMWRLRYDNCNDGLIIGAGGGAAQGAFIDENFANPLTSVDFAGAGAGSTSNDVATMALDPDGIHCYMLIALGGGGIDNMLYKLPVAGLAPTTWQVASAYSFEEVLTNQYVMAGTNGFNGMICGFDYLYTYDGQTIKQWNKANGTLIAQVASGQVGTSPPGSPPGMPLSYGGGIDVDICGNIYVGAGDVINVYDDNLNLITTYPLPNTCYDIIMGEDNKFYACGDDFVTQIDISNTILLSSTPEACGVCDGTAEFTTPNCSGAANLDILWSPSGQTTQTATGLCEGWHVVTLSSGCNATTSFVDSIYVDVDTSSCLIDVTLISDTICVGECVDLMATVSNATGAVTYQWNNGIIDITAGPINVCPTVTTTYQVIATDAMGEIDTATATITVFSIPVVNLGNDTLLCQGDLILDAQNSGSSYTWQDGSTNQTFTASFSGTYFVSVENGGCIKSDTIVVEIGGPSVDLGPDTTTCAAMVLDAGNSGANFSWQDGSTNQTFDVTNPGTFWVEVTDLNGCMAADTIVITLGTLDVDLGNDTILCLGAALTLDAENSGATYLWQDSSTNQTLDITSAGIYFVYVEDGLCNNSDTVTIDFTGPEPSFSVIDTMGCEPLTTTFTDQSVANDGTIIQWDWDFGDNTYSTLQNPTHSYSSSGTYTVSLTVTTDNGCSNTDTAIITIEVYSQPVANFNYSPNPIIVDEEVFFMDLSTDASSWFWEFGDNSTSTIENPVYTYSTPSNMLVTLIVNNDNCADTTSIIITINEELIYYVPNAFTPDDDEFNQTFKPVFTAGFDPFDFNLLIFNRWGELVFESHDSNEGWDGTYGGKVVPDGVYIWKIEFKEMMTDKRHSIHGHVNIIR